LHSLSWNPDQGWIACGGEAGLLKVLKLESSAGRTGPERRAGPSSNLSMNQTLEGHNGTVCCVTWNANYRKLTTSDQNGLIIVWMLHKGMWFEEMINNRNKSVVNDMKWTSDGQKICIIYEDGAVIVGSVDGNRLWGKELDLSLCFVEWAPDGRYLLFVSAEGKVALYDNQGNRIRDLPLPAIEDLGEADMKQGAAIIGVHWYDGAEGYQHPGAPSLAVAFANGRVQISRGDEDDSPVLLDTRMKLTQCRWNSNGTILALAGQHVSQLQGGEMREISMVQFYTPFGQLLKTLKVPGSGISALSWEGGGLRVALAVDAYIYFANIRPDYKWGYCANSLVYAYNKVSRASGTKPGEEDTEMVIVFWDLSSQERNTKYVRGLVALRAAGEHAVLVTQSCEQEKARDNEARCTVQLCNAIGSPIDTRQVSVSPQFVAMTATHTVVADQRTVYIWQFRSQVSKVQTLDISIPTNVVRRNMGRERMLDIDEPSTNPSMAVENFKRRADVPSDPISAVTASETCLLVARESGSIHKYTLPHISFECKFQAKPRAGRMQMNCTSTKCGLVDFNGVFSILDMEAKPDPNDTKGEHVFGEMLEFERKDCWDFCWALDNPDLIAIMEKTRMFIYRNLQPEDPTMSAAFLAQFNDLEVKSVLLDEIMYNPENPEPDMVFDHETQTLKDARELIRNVGLQEAYSYINSNSHIRLWRLLAEASLEALDFPMADKAFVRCKDYQGIQYVKRLQELNDRMKQRAEVAVYFKHFDEAESIYREIDRKDLAIDLRMRLGDWFRVVQLVQSGGGDDKTLASSWNQIGDYYADRLKWSKAVQYYGQAKNLARMAECYYRLEDYRGLQKIIDMVPDGHPLLIDIGAKFESVGIHQYATGCYLKGGDPKAAIDCCVRLNQWNRAVELAEEFDFPQIEGLLAKAANELLLTGDKLQAVELFRKANKATDAAKMLAAMAEDVGKIDLNPLQSKKLSVLAALEVERFRKRTLDMATHTGNDIAQATQQTLETLMTVSDPTEDGGKGSKVLDNAWRGAEAYHYYILAQRQLYSAKMESAMKTSIRLAEFEDILDPKHIYSIIALTSFNAQYLNICSRAFIKLETLTDLTEKERDDIQNLALTIFLAMAPNDIARIDDEYIRCLETGTPYQACTVSGKAILDGRTLMCRTCRHFALEAELRGITHCPLCHSTMLG